MSREFLFITITTINPILSFSCHHAETTLLLNRSMPVSCSGTNLSEICNGRDRGFLMDVEIFPSGHVQLAASRFGFVNGSRFVHLVLYPKTLPLVISLPADQYQLYLRYAGCDLLFSRNRSAHTVDRSAPDYGRRCIIDKVREKQAKKHRPNGTLKHYHELVRTD